MPCSASSLRIHGVAVARVNTITTKDGVEIFYKDWARVSRLCLVTGGHCRPIICDAQMLFFLGKGFRVIAHDRRGHGRSSQTGSGHDMDHYADDLAALTADLDLKDALHVGHSTGGGEVVHYLARHGRKQGGKSGDHQRGATANSQDGD
jgi:non-heme chloroperoxidase